jgi:hypothetical protein
LQRIKGNKLGIQQIVPRKVEPDLGLDFNPQVQILHQSVYSYEKPKQRETP